MKQSLHRKCRKLTCVIQHHTESEEERLLIQITAINAYAVLKKPRLDFLIKAILRASSHQKLISAQLDAISQESSWLVYTELRRLW